MWLGSRQAFQKLVLYSYNHTFGALQKGQLGMLKGTSVTLVINQWHHSMSMHHGCEQVSYITTSNNGRPLLLVEGVGGQWGLPHLVLTS
jgi:hypothetical protein